MYRASHHDRSVLVSAFLGRIIGLDVNDGSIRWEHRFPKGERSREEVELIDYEGRLYASNGERLMCFTYPEGTPIFDVAIPGEWKNRPVIVIEDGRLFLAASGVVTAFDLDGKVLWHNGLQGRGVGPVALGFPGNFRQADEHG